MRWLASVALAAVLTLPPGRATAQGPEAGLVFDASAAAPDRYAPLAWNFAGKLTPGYWYTESQVLAIDRRIRYLEAACSKAQVDAQIVEAKGSTPPWVWIVSGAIVGGAATWAALRVAK